MNRAKKANLSIRNINFNAESADVLAESCSISGVQHTNVTISDWRVFRLGGADVVTHSEGTSYHHPSTFHQPSPATDQMVIVVSET